MQSLIQLQKHILLPITSDMKQLSALKASMDHLSLKTSFHAGKRNSLPVSFDETVQERFRTLIALVDERQELFDEPKCAVKLIESLNTLMCATALPQQIVSLSNIGRASRSLHTLAAAAGAELGAEIWECLTELCLTSVDVAPLRERLWFVLKLFSEFVPDQRIEECLGLFISAAEQHVLPMVQLMQHVCELSSHVRALSDECLQAIVLLLCRSLDSLSASDDAANITVCTSVATFLSSPLRLRSGAVVDALLKSLLHTLSSTRLHKECATKAAMAFLSALSSVRTETELLTTLDALLGGTMPFDALPRFARLSLLRACTICVPLTTLCTRLFPLFDALFAFCSESELSLRAHSLSSLALWLDRLSDTLRQRLMQRQTHERRIEEALDAILLELLSNWNENFQSFSRALNTLFSSWLRLASLADNATATALLLERLWAMPRQSRAKYDVLRLLVPELGAGPLLAHRELVAELIECSIGERASGAPHTLLVTLLSAAFVEFKDTERWLSLWLPSLVASFTSCSSLVALDRLRSHVLPALFHCCPASLPRLLHALSASSSLRPLIAVAQTARSLSLLVLDVNMKSPSLTDIKSALLSESDALRLEALALVCCSRATSQLPSDTELSLLRDSMHMFLKSDSAATRSRTTRLLQRLLLRIRTNKGSDADKANAVSFVHWFSSLLQSQLYPGVPNARLGISLELLFVLSDLFPSAARPAAARLLSAFGSSWERHRQLCRGIFDHISADALPGFEARADVIQLVQCACERASSTVSGEAEAAAQLLLLVFQRYCGGTLRWRLSVCFDDDDNDDVELEAEHVFVRGVVRRLRLMAGVLRARPIAERYRGSDERAHGFVRLLQELFRVVQPSPARLQQWRTLAADAVDVLLELLDLSMQLHSEDVGFVDCRGHICLQDAEDDVVDDDDVDETGSSRLLVAMSWHTIKEVVSALEVLCTMGDVELLVRHDQKRIFVALIETLLTAKHKGIVTHTHGALQNLSRLHLDDLVPAQIERLLSKIAAANESDQSWIRCSAGIPFCIVAMLRAERTHRARPLLQSSLHTLLQLASTSTLPLPPRIHALNVVRSLVRDRVLAPAALASAGALTELSVRLLGSSDWSLRNAALTSFAAIVSSLIRSAGTNGRAFFAQHQCLHAFFVKQLAAPDASAASLHALLLVLANLQPSNARVHDDVTQPFLQSVRRLASHCSLLVRAMAARALAALVPLPLHAQEAQRLLESLPARPPALCHNRVHGVLLQLRHLNVDFQVVPDELVTSRLWLSSEVMSCAVIRSVALTLFTRLRPPRCKQLRRLLEDAFDNSSSGSSPGWRRMQTAALRLLASEPSSLAPLLRALQRGGVQRTEALQYITDEAALYDVVLHGSVAVDQRLACDALVRLPKRSLPPQLRPRLLEFSVDSASALELFCELEGTLNDDVLTLLEAASAYDRDLDMRLSCARSLSHLLVRLHSGSGVSARPWLLLLQQMQDESSRVRAVVAGDRTDLRSYMIECLQGCVDAGERCYELMERRVLVLKVLVQSARKDKSLGVYRIDRLNEFEEELLASQLLSVVLSRLELDGAVWERRATEMRHLLLELLDWMADADPVDIDEEFDAIASLLLLVLAIGSSHDAELHDRCRRVLAQRSHIAVRQLHPALGNLLKQLMHQHAQPQDNVILEQHSLLPYVKPETQQY